ncbi:glutamine amidotransferase [Comamonas sp.]|uniref:glutamine amidotransferase n=1 Tax=Comamonas sp. TaxID=34028 RepID=UPI002FCA336F
MTTADFSPERTAALWILKTGSTLPELVPAQGDFEDWVRTGLGPLECPLRVLQADQAAAPQFHWPHWSQVAGIVITGSHAMVTDELPWMQACAAWLRAAVDRGVPVLGICFGHQLLGHALGGVVGPNPRGLELGTVTVEATPAAAADPLWHALPPAFAANAVHYQSVLQPPPGAVLLARNAHEGVHAFRMGAACWGVQFHPEFNAQAMQGYIAHLKSAPALAGPTPDAASLLARFAVYAGCSAS